MADEPDDRAESYFGARDPSRLVDGPSDWVDTGTGDISDHHEYRKPVRLPGTDPARPRVYGECGGLKLAIAGAICTQISDVEVEINGSLT